MTKYERCPACNGSRRIMGGGMMMRDCHGCDGTGQVILIPDNDDCIRCDDQKETVVIVKKKMGRPKKRVD